MIMSLKFDEGDSSSKPSKQNSLLTDKSALSGIEPPKEYEIMIQKLEAEARNHIRIEQQLKLHIESLQFKIEENTNDLEKEKAKNKILEDVF